MLRSFEIFKCEVKALLFSSTTFLAISLVYSVGLGAAVGNGQFNAGRADLQSLFDVMPLCLGVLAAYATVRVWREAFSPGALDVLLSAPTPFWRVVIAKFCAALVFPFGLLLAIAPLWALLNMLSSPDNGAIAVGLFGQALLGASYLALSFAAPLVVASRIRAFGLALGTCLAASLFALPLIQSFALPNLGAGLTEILASLSPPTRVVLLENGVVEASAILFFVTLVALGLLSATLAGLARRER